MQAICSTFPLLENIALVGCALLSDSSLFSLTQLQQLISLNLSFCQGISDSGFAHLVRLRSVLKLGLQSTQISSAGVRALGQLPALTRLSLRECKQIDDSHCADLCRVESLRELDLACSSLSDAGAMQLAILPALVELDVSSTRVSATGAVELLRSRRLRVLNLSGCSLMAASLPSQKVLLPEEGKMGVRNSNETELVNDPSADREVQALRRRFPTCSIIQEAEADAIYNNLIDF